MPRRAPRRASSERQGGQRRDGADGIGTGRGHGPGDGAHIRRHRGELDDERQVGGGAGGHRGGLGRLDIEADGLAAAAPVGAGQVELEAGDVGLHVEAPGEAGDVLDVVGADADDDGHVGRWPSADPGGAAPRRGPGFCSPTELSSPSGSGAIRGGGLPDRGRRVMLRVTMAPGCCSPTASSSSLP